MNGWNAQGFTVRTDQGEREIAGWVNGVFALDFRVFREDHYDYDIDTFSGWQLTHIPTGFKAFGILTPLDRATKLADELASAADWNFTDPAEAKRLSKVARDFMEAHPNDVVRWDTVNGPLMAWPNPPADPAPSGAAHSATIYGSDRGDGNSQ